MGELTLLWVGFVEYELKAFVLRFLSRGCRLEVLLSEKHVHFDFVYIALKQFLRRQNINLFALI